MKINVLCISVLWLTSKAFTAGPPPATPVVVDNLKLMDVVKHTRVSGRVVSKQMAGLSTQVSGKVVVIHHDEGAWVKAGEILMELDSEVVSLQIKELQLELEVKMSQVRRSQQLLKVQAQEFDDLNKADQAMKGSVSKKEMRTEESKVIQLKGEIHQLQTEAAVLKTKLAQLKLNLEHHQLKAPFDGQILERRVAEGHWINVGEVSFRLSNPNKIEVELDIPDHLFFEVANAGSTFQAMVSGTKTLVELENMRVKREVNPQTKTFVWTGQPKKVNLVVHGMSVEADVPTAQPSKELMVNYNAILKNDAGAYVYKVIPGQAGKMAVPIPVKLGFRKNELVVVKSAALQAGDQVVSEGGERLFPMTPVTPTNEAQ